MTFSKGSGEEALGKEEDLGQELSICGPRGPAQIPPASPRCYTMWVASPYCGSLGPSGRDVFKSPTLGSQIEVGFVEIVIKLSTHKGK